MPWFSKSCHHNVRDLICCSDPREFCATVATVQVKGSQRTTVHAIKWVFLWPKENKEPKQAREEVAAYGDNSRPFFRGGGDPPFPKDFWILFSWSIGSPATTNDNTDKLTLVLLPIFADPHIKLTVLSMSTVNSHPKYQSGGRKRQKRDRQ